MNAERITNPTLESIAKRTSVRSFTDQPVTDAQMEAMLRAAMAAPTGMNVQPWSFVVLRDKARYEEVFKGNFNLRIFRTAAAVVVFCADTTVTRAPRNNPQGEKVTMPNGTWRDDMGACTENFMVAAASLGLGTVWTASYPYPDRYLPIKEDTTSAIIVAVNLFFLLLGALLCVYAERLGGFEALGITKTDQLFPTIASRYLGFGAGIFFLIGLISASYPSAGAAMTSLTTSVCVDFLGFNERKDWDESRKSRVRKGVQALVALLFFVLILLLFLYSNDAIINLVYKLASYTYGPLLGIFFFGILSKRRVCDRATPWIALAAPLLCLAINVSGKRFLGFDLGFTLLIVNGALTYLGMWISSLTVAHKTVKA